MQLVTIKQLSLVTKIADCIDHDCMHDHFQLHYIPWAAVHMQSAMIAVDLCMHYDTELTM